MDSFLGAGHLVELHFPRALQILDLYHARQHVSDLCKVLFEDSAQIARQRLRWWAQLDEGRIGRIVTQAQLRLPLDPDRTTQAQAELAYLQNHRHKMRYADFRQQGLFVGSGVVEAACKTVIAQRLKQSGMEWSMRGANAIISLRCVRQSGRFEEFWEARAG